MRTCYNRAGRFVRSCRARSPTSNLPISKKVHYDHGNMKLQPLSSLMQMLLSRGVAMLSLSPSYGLAKLAVEYNICFEVVTYDTLMIWIMVAQAIYLTLAINSVLILKAYCF
ncbi:uncharacterized protein LOC124677735 isoform X2 [Lolium rigidum]|uniref:uncharacterized protein LOC124677735 isoform X2 n=1 Tax=Lolium rigidum TaxID=89674 RepID=UPI001F5C4B85|nr:uncharacterized protein LOC124677735 isoform X2 [Lolium rigidum]